MSKLIFLAVACIGVCAAVAVHRRNVGPSHNYDSPLNFQCGNSQAIKRIQGRFSSSHKDRIYVFSCASYGSGGVCSDCKTTNHYVNELKEVLSYNCPANQVLTGVESIHVNRQEDRRWKFRCCATFEHVTTNCELTDYINKFRQEEFDYTVEGGKVVVGMHSHFAREDRQWKLMVCDYHKKQACDKKEASYRDNDQSIV